MKFRNILLLSLVLLFITSCSEDYKMKKDFKEAYTGIMNDADSYELVSFQIFQNASEFSEENRRFLDNSYELNKKHEDYSKVWDSLFKIEEQNNRYFLYTGVLVTIRGKNSYGAKVLSEHIAYYSDSDIGGRLKVIDGDIVSGNRILRGFKLD